MNDLKAVVLAPSLTPFEQLRKLMEILRSPEGCQWDRAQTHHTLVPYLIEEAYEVVESIEAGDMSSLKEELGDLLLQVVFHAQIAGESGDFSLDDTIRVIIDKLIKRHPHIFGEKKKLAPQQVRDQWEKIKTESGEKRSVLSGLPRGMPALTTAFRMGEKAGGVGFDWPSAAEALEKVKEEIAELEVEISSDAEDASQKISEELGDLLFAVSSVARLNGVEPETALRRALDKFRKRFDLMEAEIISHRGRFGDYTLEEMEEIWQRIKGLPE